MATKKELKRKLRAALADNAASKPDLGYVKFQDQKLIITSLKLVSIDSTGSNLSVTCTRPAGDPVVFTAGRGQLYEIISHELLIITGKVDIRLDTHIGLCDLFTMNINIPIQRSNSF